MDRQVLVSAVGFRAAMVLPLVEATRPDEVFLISGHHRKVSAARKEILASLQKAKLPVSEVQVEDWDMQAWSEAVQAALDRFRNDRVTVNVTAGHGLAVAMLAIHAAQRGLPVACYDWEGFEEAGAQPKDLHSFVRPHSPAAVLNLKDTQPIDRAVLGLLLRGDESVAALVKALDGPPQSTVSTSLARLLEKGFLRREGQGRGRRYALRAGIEPMIEKALGIIAHRRNRGGRP